MTDSNSNAILATTTIADDTMTNDIGDNETTDQNNVTSSKQQGKDNSTNNNNDDDNSRDTTRMATYNAYIKNNENQNIMTVTGTDAKITMENKNEDANATAVTTAATTNTVSTPYTTNTCTNIDTDTDTEPVMNTTTTTTTTMVTATTTTMTNTEEEEKEKAFLFIPTTNVMNANVDASGDIIMKDVDESALESSPNGIPGIGVIENGGQQHQQEGNKDNISTAVLGNDNNYPISQQQQVSGGMDVTKKNSNTTTADIAATLQASTVLATSNSNSSNSTQTVPLVELQPPHPQQPPQQPQSSKGDNSNHVATTNYFPVSQDTHTIIITTPTTTTTDALAAMQQAASMVMEAEKKQLKRKVEDISESNNNEINHGINDIRNGKTDESSTNINTNTNTAFPSSSPPASKRTKTTSKIVRTSWEDRLEQLRQYKNEHGDLLIPIRYKLNPSLGKFVHNMREQYKLYHQQTPPGYKKKCSLTAKRIEQLEELGFAWTTQRAKKQEEDWNERFAQLKAFKKKHRHCLVPHGYKENPSLAEWIHRQRTTYTSMMVKEEEGEGGGEESAEKAEKAVGEKEQQPNELVKKRMEQLKKLGFSFHVHTDKWMKNYEKLKAYKEKHGDCLVTTHYKRNPKLGRWVHTQRHQRRLLDQGKKSCMTPERIALLDELNFSWEVRSAWNGGGGGGGANTNTNTADESHHNTGNNNDNNNDNGNNINNTNGGKKTTMTTTTTTINPSFVIDTAPWRQRYEELKRYHEIRQSFKVDPETRPKLHAWCHVQQHLLRQLEERGVKTSKKMNKDKIHSLSLIGFDKDSDIGEPPKGFFSSMQQDQQQQQEQQQQKQQQQQHQQEGVATRSGSDSELSAPWKDQYEELKKYYETNHTLKVDPKVMPKLHAWCHIQQRLLREFHERNDETSSKMNNDKVNAFAVLGFDKDTDIGDPPENLFQTLDQEKEKSGHDEKQEDDKSKDMKTSTKDAKLTVLTKATTLTTSTAEGNPLANNLTTTITSAVAEAPNENQIEKEESKNTTSPLDSASKQVADAPNNVSLIINFTTGVATTETDTNNAITTTTTKTTTTTTSTVTPTKNSEIFKDAEPKLDETVDKATESETITHNDNNNNNQVEV